MAGSHLRPCPACSRHVRVKEGACPFCGVSLEPSFSAAPAPLPPSRRLSRAALIALGAGSLALAPGCGESSTAMYGAPGIEMVDAGDAGGQEAGTAPGMPAYGASPADAAGHP
jgi:hypothetical protein